MKLFTLGGLRLGGTTFGRVKPLLLLAYLTLEGPKDRRHLAELFWPEASDRLNSLAAALSRLRRGAPGSFDADEVRVWTTLPSDLAELLAALGADEAARALDLYTGPFLEGVYLSDWGAELEEWVYAARERLGSRVRGAALKLAEQEAAQGVFAHALKRAEAAYALKGAPDCEPEELTRFYLLFQAERSPLAAQVRSEAEGYGVTLELSPDEARERLRRHLIGRERERERLSGLSPSEWAWVCGGAGMGKTALLRSLSGTYLPGRAGLPFATLEPLVGAAVREGEGAVLGRLLREEGTWLLDNWGLMDAPSRALLTKLRALRPRARLVITSRSGPPFDVDAVLELAPLSERELSAYPGAYEITQGLPALVEAFVRGERLDGAFEARLAALPAAAKEVYLTLALLEAPDPDPALVRRALGLDAAAMADALEALLSAALVEPSGKARVRRAALEYLDAHPTLLGPLALKLARCLEGVDAYPLYARSRSLWHAEDEPKIREAHLAWANELLRRGFPQRAVEVLEKAPAAPEVAFLKGRALERAGRYGEAFTCVQGLEETPGVLALKSTLYRQLGHPVKARDAAQGALSGDMEARAEAQNTLGNLNLSRGDYQEAAKSFRRAAALWLAVNQRTRWLGALINESIARSEMGEATEEAFSEVLAATEADPALQARASLNLGLALQRQGRLEEAIKFHRIAIDSANKAGAIVTLTRAWNNLGLCYEKSHPEKARESYNQALHLAQRTGDQYMIAMALANLSELEENLEAWEEAMHMFMKGGHLAMVRVSWEQLPEHHPFRLRSGVLNYIETTSNQGETALAEGGVILKKQ